MADKSSSLRLIESEVKCESVYGGEFVHERKKTSVRVVEKGSLV